MDSVADPKLFGQVGSGSGIIGPDPGTDLTFLTRKSVYNCFKFLLKMVQFIFDIIHFFLRKSKMCLESLIQNDLKSRIRIQNESFRIQKMVVDGKLSQLAL